jgi:hypothetical protein
MLRFSKFSICRYVNLVNQIWTKRPKDRFRDPPRLFSYLINSSPILEKTSPSFHLITQAQHKRLLHSIRTAAVLYSSYVQSDKGKKDIKMRVTCFKAFVLASLTVAGVASFALRPKKSKHSSDKVSKAKWSEANWSYPGHPPTHRGGRQYQYQ